MYGIPIETVKIAVLAARMQRALSRRTRNIPQGTSAGARQTAKGAVFVKACVNSARSIGCRLQINAFMPRPTFCISAVV